MTEAPSAIGEPFNVLENIVVAIEQPEEAVAQVVPVQLSVITMHKDYFDGPVVSRTHNPIEYLPHFRSCCPHS
jgi:hypothetical protein